MIERFSTCRIEPSKRLDFWNELIGSTYDGLVMDSPNPFLNAELLRWRLGDNTLIWPKSPAASVERFSQGVRRTSERKVVAHVVHAGSGRLISRGREVPVAAGDLVVCASDEWYRFDMPGAHEMLVLEFARGGIEDRIPMLDDRIAHCVSGKHSTTRLLHRFVLSLWNEGQLNLGSHAEQAYGAIVEDMFAASLLAPAGDGGRANGLFQRLRHLIERRFSDPEVTAAMLAEELGVSMRTMQLAAAAAGTTPVACLIDRRLDHAALELRTDPRASVTLVAFHSGFSDSAYFTRRFHERYGMSPRQYRRIN
ncbi:transcriptional regulator, AraC family [Novosphingobium sp. CF614]|uniref:helix-turn-helix domain-containing protein n=1 Tax=Novosphingobium sp. CF614 TaxID=1884364 RepID=UPI0008EBD5E9|nr:helix-turn-helix domain-containing protein [Novosphingobium sp. CF614]SFF89833.1 transcriptional regulator, AraC family [Novosphingobium sp. CF614]